MTDYDELHSNLRGNALESRQAVAVLIEGEADSRAQQALLQAHIDQSGVPGKTALVATGDTGIYKLLYWRTDSNTYPAPNPTQRMVGP